MKQYSLGQKYTEDKSRHKDNEQAIFWLEKSVLQGHTFVSNALWLTLIVEKPQRSGCLVSDIARAECLMRK